MNVMRRSALLLSGLAAGLAAKAFSAEVKINDDFAVESDGTLRLDNDATVWDDLRVPMTALKKGKTVPEEKNFPYDDKDDAAVRLDWFRPSGIDEMFFVVQMPHSWAEGTAIKPHVHWTPSENGSGVVKWGLDYTWMNLGETHSAYTTLTATAIKPDGTTTLKKDSHYLTPLGTMDGTGKQISSMLVCRIFRDGDDSADTYSGKAGILEVDFHYQINTMGSRLEFTK